MKFDGYKNSDIINAINEYIHNEKYRDILIDRFVNGLIFDDLAQKYNLSVQQVKNIIYKYGDVILNKLQG